MNERPPAVVDFSSFPQPPSALYRDYLAGSPRALDFFEGGWDHPTLQDAARRTQALARPRAEVAALLAAQQEGRGAARAAAQARRLAEPGAVAVVTGQQPVLFGGPLYVLYKALAALELARRLEAESGVPAVPVFWVAGDDHDFEEIRAVAVLDGTGAPHAIRYAPLADPGGRPASAIVLDESIEARRAELAAALPEGPGRGRVLEAAQAAYRPGRDMAGAFAAFLSALLPELVVLDPADPALRRLAAPVLRRELEEGSPTTRLALAAGTRLLAAGYHQQVPLRPGFLNLFLVQEGERRPLAFAEDTVEVRGTGQRLGRREALELFDRDPGAWSAGVLLRPLVQDTLLPTAAYIGGPAEVAYHAQIGPSYGWLGLPRPVVFPRPSLSLVEPAAARALQAEELSLPELQADPGALLSRSTRQANPELEAAFARARSAVERELDAVEKALAGLDPTLAAAAHSTAGRMLHPLDALHEKSVRALKKRDEARAERLRRTRDALMPGGGLQERGLGLCWLLARHGEAVLDELRARIDPWARGHQVLYL